MLFSQYFISIDQSLLIFRSEPYLVLVAGATNDCILSQLASKNPVFLSVCPEGFLALQNVLTRERGADHQLEAQRRRKEVNGFSLSCYFGLGSQAFELI